MRSIVPELLDSLPASDPRAQRSRRDLALINGTMRQSAIMALALARFPAPALLADLGGGDGRFLLDVARRISRNWRSVKVMVLDRHDIVSCETRAGFEELGWRCEVMTGDIFETLPLLRPDIVIANLFLHHLNDVALARLFDATAQRAGGFAACEPRRSRFALAASRMVFALGANDVTRHDAVASVRAGFAGKELSALWPHEGWSLAEQAAFPFSHVFTAIRNV
ncbi:MAG TPA: methyltransferase [Rhizomicrobium sp.]